MESAVCRSPHGERGLKYLFMLHKRRYNMSLPVCGAWIEISKNILWISGALKSLPARGAWIEMTYRNKLIHCDSVAPRMWSVD